MIELNYIKHLISTIDMFEFFGILENLKKSKRSKIDQKASTFCRRKIGHSLFFMRSNEKFSRKNLFLDYK